MIVHAAMIVRTQNDTAQSSAATTQRIHVLVRIYSKNTSVLGACRSITLSAMATMLSLN
jgi:hypothetical protein